MKRRGSDFEREANEGHNDADNEKRLHRGGGQFLPNCGEPGRARHAVDEADSEKRECARRAAEQEIFQARFGGADIAFVERGQDIQRETREFEPDEDHEQLFTANEQHEPDRRE